MIKQQCCATENLWNLIAFSVSRPQSNIDEYSSAAVVIDDKNMVWTTAKMSVNTFLHRC